MAIVKHYSTSIFPFVFGIGLLTLAAVVSLSNASFKQFDLSTYFAIAFVLLDFIVINIFLGTYYTLELTHERMVGRNVWGKEINVLYYADMSHLSSRKYRKNSSTKAARAVVISQSFHKDLVIHLQNGEEITIESAIIHEIDELTEALNYYIEKQNL